MSNSSAVAALRASLPPEIFALVVEPAQLTKKELRTRIRDFERPRGLSIRAALDAVVEGRSLVRSLRTRASAARQERQRQKAADRAARRAEPHRVRSSDSAAKCNGVRSRRPSYELPSGALEARLLDRTSKALCARSPLRSGAAGGSSLEVEFVEEPENVRYDVRMERTYDVYHGAFKGWSARVDRHTVYLRRSWLRLVHRRDLTVLDGLLTLDAREEPCADPAVALYAATWASQSRGYSARTERGYVAVSAGLSHHADTPEAALRGLERKRAQERAADFGSLVETLVRDHGALRLVRDDAYRIGACRPGVEAWLHRVGLADRESAALVEVAAAYRAHPAPEALLAMRAVARRARAGADDIAREADAGNGARGEVRVPAGYALR